MSEGEDQLRALMIRYQGGSLEAFQEIYGQLAAAVRRYLFHLAGGSEIADDLLQETFLQMHGRGPLTTRHTRSGHGCSAWHATFS